ncbi:MAG: hypothetical protein RIB53_00950 [Roseitalea porphyridii]|uniref:hypothetical protein n=1 Tax=Roseitalea porphyridii TaxID=1852022 RepID=UPI0032EF866F
MRNINEVASDIGSTSADIRRALIHLSDYINRRGEGGQLFRNEIKRAAIEIEDGLDKIDDLVETLLTKKE